MSNDDKNRESFEDWFRQSEFQGWSLDYEDGNYLDADVAMMHAAYTGALTRQPETNFDELRPMIIDALIATQKQSEGVTADAIIFSIYKYNLEKDKKIEDLECQLKLADAHLEAYRSTFGESKQLESDPAESAHCPHCANAGWVPSDTEFESVRCTHCKNAEYLESVGAASDKQPESEPIGYVSGADLDTLLNKRPGCYQINLRAEKYIAGGITKPVFISPQPAALPEGWTPTAANINALPAPVRGYIHDLEASADPAGMVRENILVRDENKMLRSLVDELQQASQVPDEMTLERAAKFVVDGSPEDGAFRFVDGWNMCREYMLSGSPQPSAAPDSTQWTPEREQELDDVMTELAERENLAQSQPAAPLQGAAISCDHILDIFKGAGMHIDIGANFSAKGQIAQLINGAKELLAAPQPPPAVPEGSALPDVYAEAAAVERFWEYLQQSGFVPADRPSMVYDEYMLTLRESHSQGAFTNDIL